MKNFLFLHLSNEFSFRENKVTLLKTSQFVFIYLCIYLLAEVHIHGCDSVEAVIRLVVTALMGVAAAAAAVLLVNDLRSARG